MPGPEEQDKLSDAWGLDSSMLGEKAQSESTSALEGQWSLDGEADGGGVSGKTLKQDDIDNLFGFEQQTSTVQLSGVQALINSALVSYERLPMLEIVFDRLVRLATTSLRNFTSDNVEVSLEAISSVRFGDYLNSIPLPAILSVFKAEEWDNYGLLTIDSALIYSMIDVLLGGRRVSGTVVVEGRPYTTIEMALARRMIEVILDDAHKAFEPVTDINFKVERIETNPRFAVITRPANASILIELKIDMDERGGKVEILLPYSTIEPIREQLLQAFMGEKFGRDPIWEAHLATEIYDAEVSVDAIMHEENMPLSRVMTFEAGQTLVFDRAPGDPVTLRCGDTDLTEAVMGHIGRHVSVRVTKPLKPPKVTMAAFDALDSRGT